MVSHNIPAALLSIARRVLREVLEKFNLQRRVVEGVRDAVIGTYLPLADTWQGPDAEQFRAQVHQQLVPAIGNIILAMLGFQTSIKSAEEVIDKADATVCGYINDLGDTARNIVKL